MCAVRHNVDQHQRNVREHEGQKRFSRISGASYRIHLDYRRPGMASDVLEVVVIRPAFPVWRYMDLAKFVMMLKKSSLYFSSPTEFSDIYEGAHGELRNKEVWDQYYLSFAKTAIITAPDNRWYKKNKNTLLREAKQIAGSITKKNRENFFLIVGTLTKANQKPCGRCIQRI